MSQVVPPEIKLATATKRPPSRSRQRNIVRCQQPRKGVTCEKRVFALALAGHWIEADQDVIDKTGVAPDEAAVRQAIEKLPHQFREIRVVRKIVGPGESRVECDVRARRAAPELRA